MREMLISSSLLAQTGTDSGTVTILLVLGAVLAGLGVLLITLRIVQRRRSWTTQERASAPSVDSEVSERPGTK